MEKAIICKWECPGCGNVSENKQVLQANAKGTKFSFKSPASCACDRKEGFKLLGFDAGTATIKKDTEK